MAIPYITALRPIDHVQATGRTKVVLDRALSQVGFIPNMYANMANAPAVLDTYLHGYGYFRGESGFSPAEQEVVFLAISRANGCSYCTAAHSMIADKMSRVPADVLKAIMREEPIPDEKLAALFAMTEDIVVSRGRPSPDNVRRYLRAGFDEQSLLYIVLAASVKVLSNYTNHAFATPVDAAFAAYATG